MSDSVRLSEQSTPATVQPASVVKSGITQPYRETQRLEFLDSIRGLAALAVLLSHSFFAAMWPPIIDHTLNAPYINLPFNGKEAVAMFFVLSGFVLSRPYFSANGQAPRKLYLPTFYLRRFIRIWPPWFVAFCLSALAQAFLFRPWTTSPPLSGWFVKAWHAPLTLVGVLRQCVFMEHNVAIQLIPQDWSLGVELKASALLPLFVFLYLTRSFWTLLAASIAMFVFVSTGHYYVLFVFGVLLAELAPRLVAWLQPKPLLTKISLLFLGITLYGTHHLGNDLLHRPVWEKYYWIVTGAGCVLIILAALASRRIQNALHLRPIVFLGRISYSVYLLQYIVVMCVLPPWMHLLNNLGIQRTVWLLPLSGLAAVAVTVALSALSYAYVEKPCIKLGHALSKEWQARFAKRQ